LEELPTMVSTFKRMAGLLPPDESARWAALLGREIVTRAVKSRTPADLLQLAGSYRAATEKVPVAMTREDASLLSRAILDAAARDRSRNAPLLLSAWDEVADQLPAGEVGQGADLLARRFLLSVDRGGKAQQQRRNHV